MPVRHVVFDIGNVLVDWDPRHLYRALFPDRPDQMEWFLRHVCTPVWNLEQDGGRTWREGVAQLAVRLPEWRPEIEAFDRRWHDMIPGVIGGTVEILDELKAHGVRLFAITNFSTEKYRESFARFAFLRSFEGVLVSGDEHLLKPAAPIFRLLATRYGVSLSDCVFIDDSAANIEGAAAVGMTAILFKRPDLLRLELRRFGLPV